MLFGVGVRKEKAAETEAALKQAAREQFAARGYRNTKITDITAAAGRATGSFYEHFAGKDQLLQALVADMHAEAHGELADADHPPHDLTDRDELRRHLSVAWRLMRDNRAVTTALFEQAITGGNGEGLLWRRLTDDTRMLREHLEHTVAEGGRLPGNPTLVAAAIGGVLSMLAHAQPADDPDYTDEQVLDAVTNLLHAGLANAAGGPPSPEANSG
jgi:AcrR family transcriptional regulator